ncbi:MAG: hypothetical protein MMC23_001084 [Stictis urceolatum]|nr:hypothetical protein [Stictis urceolata]
MSRINEVSLRRNHALKIVLGQANYREPFLSQGPHKNEQDLDYLAKQICLTYRVDQPLRQGGYYGRDNQKKLLKELMTLPPFVAALLHSRFCPPSSSSLVKPDGDMLMLWLQRCSTKFVHRLFLVLLAQACFAMIKEHKECECKLSCQRIVCDMLPAGKKPTQYSSCLSGKVCLPERPTDHGNSLRVRLEAGPVFDVSTMEALPDLASLPGKTVGLIGAGGGSDCVQAAMLGILSARAGKNVKFVASIRAAKTSSEDPKGDIGAYRTVSNHGGEVSPGVFQITSRSSGSGRFVENVPANMVPMYLITEDASPGGLSCQIDSLITFTCGRLNAECELDTLILVDTGGDVLEDPNKDLQGHEQHQDLRVLHALGSRESPLRKKLPQLSVLTAIVAPGIDAPPGAPSKLEKAKAQFYLPLKQDREHILSRYVMWDFTGSEQGLQAGRYGKTPFAWQAAMKAMNEYERAKSESKDFGKALDDMPFHTAVVPLPRERVMDERNPWDPFVPLQYAMAGVFLMDAEELLKVVMLGA